jgi:hypothetical protein
MHLVLFHSVDIVNSAAKSMYPVLHSFIYEPSGHICR